MPQVFPRVCGASLQSRLQKSLQKSFQVDLFDLIQKAPGRDQVLADSQGVLG
jgi:hypothetical protein